MKIITFDKIKSLGIHSSQCYRWAEYMIRNKKNAILPPKISMKPYDGVFCNVMPSIITVIIMLMLELKLLRDIH